MHKEDLYNNCGFEYPINNDYYNIMNRILVASLLSMASIAVTSWLIGKYLLDNDLIDKVEEEREPKVLFEEKYSLKDMEHDLSRNNEVTKNTSVIENTPDGLVIMLYNGKREGFEYWCDNKNIKFDYLETVARKFVIMNFCTSLYIDRYEDIKKQQDDFDDFLETGNDKENDKENDEENDKENDDFLENDKEKIEESVFVKKKKKKKEVKKEDRKKIVAKNCNKYLYIGKINEFEWIRKSEETRIVKELSFASFKSMFG